MIVFLDDLDYADEDWWMLLDFLMPLASSDYASVVFSVRPPLVASLDIYDDRFRHVYCRDVQRINLAGLNVQNVLTSRLVPFLIERDTALNKFFKRLFRRDAKVYRLLDRLGLRDLSELPRFDYPFTSKHNSFMSRITNGNLREIFEIALESLDFVMSSHELLERVEDGVVRKVIGRENVLRLFADPEEPPYKIVNIHARRSAMGNSLVHNTLHAVKCFRCLDASLYSTLRSLGHSKNDVDWAVEYLQSRHNRFIVPIAIQPANARQGSRQCSDFKVTEKGNYYLQIAEWEEYKKRFGDCGKDITR